MNLQSTCRHIVLIGIFIFPHLCFAKGSFGHEFSILYRFENAKSSDRSYSVHELNSALLVPYKAFWIGGEASFSNSTYYSVSTSQIEIGGIAKYWIVEPGNNVGFNLFFGTAIGQEDRGDGTHSTLALKVGPELAWFVWEGAAVSTRLQYTMRRAGESYTIMGIYTGLSLFF